MFTGLIEEVGRVVSVTGDSATHRLTVASSKLLPEMKTGDSIAVSGVCLTAVEVTGETFSADLAAETLARTSLSRLKPGVRVNLELPMKADGRMGGHMVQGHVDGTGKFVALEEIERKEDYWLRLEIPWDLTKYVVFKGSIAVEGISLTVARLEGTEATIAIIPHTLQVTNLAEFKPGDPINLEVDVVAKYVEKMLGQAAPSAVTLEWLVREGF